MGNQDYFFKNNQWFFEKDFSEGIKSTKVGKKIKKRIFSAKTPYQKIDIIDTLPFGRILAIDGVTQLAENDEFIYHEILANLPLFYHPNPKQVLIVGGGDGGILREVLKHPVEKVSLVDIDPKIIEVSKKYLPFVHKGSFGSKRAEIIIGDGLKFVKKCDNFFDVIIQDSTDPSGPSLGLFSRKFYQDVFSALNKNGILAVQAGCLFEQSVSLIAIYKTIRKIFPFVKIHLASVPAYQCSGEYSFLIAGKNNLSKINLKKIGQRFDKIKKSFKYYSPQIHLASGILPEYLRKRFGQ